MSTTIIDFTGENYIVTGASSGMGKEIAISLAVKGAKVLAIGRNIERLEQTRTMCFSNIEIASIDVCDEVAMELTVKEFVTKYGKLKGAVHCAGIEGFSPIRVFDRKLANKIMDISFWGGINVAQIVNKKKYSLAGCSTVLFSSIASKTGKKMLFAYSASKAALNIAVKSIAKEISGDKKRINTVLPGWVKTNMTEQAICNVDIQQSIFNQHLLGLGTPNDVCNAVLFLLSDSASWITGTNFVVDGGYLAGAE